MKTVTRANVHAWIRLHSVGEMKYEQVGVYIETGKHGHEVKTLLFNRSKFVNNRPVKQTFARRIVRQL